MPPLHVAAIWAGSVFGKHTHSTLGGCRFESDPALHQHSIER